MENNAINLDWQSVLLGESLLLGVLSKAIQNVPDRQWLQTLVDEDVFSELPLDGTCQELQDGFATLKSWSEANRGGISDEQFLNLQTDYARLTIGPAQPLAPPWESVYFNEDHMIFQEQTVQVRSWYRRFGLEPEKLHQEPDDHVGLELSFLAYLAGLGLQALEAQDEPRLLSTIQSQRQFLAEHPMKWVPAWCARVEQYAHSDFYRALGCLIHGALLVLASTFDVEVPREAAR